MSQIPSKYLILHILGVSLFCVGLLLPYTSSVTPIPIGENSTIFQENTQFFETPITGFESLMGRVNVFIILSLSLLFFLSRKRWHKYFIIPLAVIYGASMLIVYVSTHDGFGRPYGDSIHSGFLLMAAGTLTVFFVISHTTNQGSVD